MGRAGGSSWARPPPAELESWLHKWTTAVTAAELVESLRGFLTWSCAEKCELRTLAPALDCWDEILAGLLASASETANVDAASPLVRGLKRATETGTDLAPMRRWTGDLETRVLVLEILRVTELLLENCSNRQTYNSWEVCT